MTCASVAAGRPHPWHPHWYSARIRYTWNVAAHNGYTRGARNRASSKRGWGTWMVAMGQWRPQLVCHLFLFVPPPKSRPTMSRCTPSTNAPALIALSGDPQRRNRTTIGKHAKSTWPVVGVGSTVNETYHEPRLPLGDTTGLQVFIQPRSPDDRAKWVVW